MTSPIDELCARLTERGVEYAIAGCGSGYVKWQANETEFMAFEHDDDLSVCQLGSVRLSPEQAIAATLGPAYEPPVAAHWDGDTLTLNIPRDPSCIRVQRSVEQPCKVYADESKVIAATLGSYNCTNGERTNGTCYITDNGPWGYPYVCSACGASFDPDVNGGEFNFCPNCGAKVVEPTTNDVDAEEDA